MNYRGRELTVKSFTQFHANTVSKILSLTQQNKIHIFKLPCNFLFIIWIKGGKRHMKDGVSAHQGHVVRNFFIFSLVKI